ncbi:hypothetical protein FH972_021523 [Carpinus fangiana]|uniref:Aminotransferase class I/classII large domain-containing protein n=1 Tax=Carpinus fangiana TaxID=176857 RepID=A0A5N6KPL0_9ROSI|nr:hypothetical protein FH972_021523 [Carpinus fangiana]
METSSTLSRRGAEIAAKSIRDLFKSILKDPYDEKKNPNGFVNMGVAENYCMVSEVAAFTNSHLGFTKLDFTYGEGPWGTSRLRKAMAAHMTKYFNAISPVDPEDILVASGVTSLCEMLGFTIADPGDGVLFTRPIYQAFEPDFGLRAGVKPVFTSFEGIDLFSTGCIAKYEDALRAAEAEGTKIRALMLCNPHNPLGACYPKQTIIAIMQFCQKHRLHLLADEIYATSVYEVDDPNAVAFTSVLSFDTAPYIDTDLVHVIYGMSKDFAGGGLRLGMMLIRNKELMGAMGAVTQFGWAGLPSQEIAATMLENEEWLASFIQTSQKTLSARNALCRSILDSKGIKYQPGSNAGFFLWIDLSPWLKPSGPDTEYKDAWEAEDALTKSLVEGGVFINGGKSLSSDTPGRFRIIFSHPEASLHEGFARLFKVLGIK